ncbi:acetyltransferase [Bombardia bombarda]|uniref:Acetyltransferase n=1 Tax=Bombardia bombarda TaxID=252184 RepID=A0AA39TX04_9PEZI|nr:acetyltransferase [Bombardia bombarda]
MVHFATDTESIDPVENKRRMLNGELHYAFTPDLGADRARCKAATLEYATHAISGVASRRKMLELWKNVTQDDTPLPPSAATPEEDDALLADYAWVDGPIKMDYGYNVKIGQGAFINSYSTWIDTCPITVGARTLVGPNCSFYSGGHPLDPFLRNGFRGPEFGKPIVIGEDCWIGGGTTIVPGVTIGRGATIGAGSVVTKDIPDFVVAVGNPARVIKKIDVVEPKEVVTAEHES